MISLKELEANPTLDDFLAKNKGIEVVHLNLVQGGNGKGNDESEDIDLGGPVDFIVEDSGSL